VRKKIKARRDRFEYQLPDAVTSISSSVKAGLALAQAVEQVAEKMPPPVSQEFALIVRQYRMGIPLDDALRTAQQRLKSRNFNLVCNALIINRERGGDLSEILERIGTSIRELYRLEEKIRTETAGPRFEARVMLFVPPFILFLFYLAQPELVGKMFRDPIGIVLVIVSIVLIGIAYLWIEKIVNEDI
jgi:tight adherence protein B